MIIVDIFCAEELAERERMNTNFVPSTTKLCDDIFGEKLGIGACDKDIGIGYV